jgi:hypothetical protein
MGFSSAKLNCCLLILGMALAAYSTAAQRAGRRPGQAILFSSPDDDNVSSNAPSLAAKPPTMDLANAVQSPAANPSAASPGGLPPPTPAISPAQVRQLQRLLDERKNWALLTPEEILGLPTREKILGLQDRDALGQPKNETVLERFYERQEQLRVRTNSNNYSYDNYSYGAAGSAPHADFSGGQGMQMNPNLWMPAGGKPENPTLLDQFLNGTTGSRAASAQAAESSGFKLFNLPASSAGAAPEPAAAAGEFQQLLSPSSPPGVATKAPALGGPILSSSSLSPKPAFGQSPAIPLGASFTPLGSGIGMPVVATPLPGVFGQTNAAPVLAPEWKPQPPPWMSSTPQLGAIPQRKF